MGCDDHDGGGGTEPDGFDTLLSAAVRVIGRNETEPQQFLDWICDAAPMLVPDSFPAGLEQIPAYWLGVALWNATPLHSNEFRPRPIPTPAKHVGCPCGSGRRFDRCCSDIADQLAIPQAAVWPALVTSHADSYWLRAASGEEFPLEGLASIAMRFRHDEKHRALIKLLEPRLLGGSDNDGDRLAWAVDLLCDAYDAVYRSDRKKAHLLSSLAQHPAAALRAEGNQRLAAWLWDQGDPEGAHNALQQAIRAEPDNPGTALLEVTLLCAGGERDLAQQRAEFWYRRLVARVDEVPEALQYLDEARRSPCTAYQAYAEQFADPLVRRLIAWIDTVAARKVCPYRISFVTTTSDKKARQRIHELVAPAAVSHAEKAWDDVGVVDKPLSVHWLPGNADSCWERADTWIALLEDQPQAFDSLDVLDDLATLVLAHPDSDDSWVVQHCLLPLLERGVAILRESLIATASDMTLPWVLLQNRPGLRLLSRLIGEYLDEDNVPATLSELIELYLRLNPDDNHGWRAIAVNLYLLSERNAEALALCDRFPDDGLPEMCFGRALAQFRLGNRAAAHSTLCEAQRYLPTVFDYLVRGRVARPRQQVDDWDSVDNKEEAWLYREQMRATWLATDGMPELLKAVQRGRSKPN